MTNDGLDAQQWAFRELYKQDDEIEKLAADLAALRSENQRLREALQAFMEPMRRYTKHATWLKGDEDMLVAAYEQARAALAHTAKEQ